MEFNNLNELEQLILARWFYSIGEPLITDAEYTILLEACKRLHPDNEYIHRTWSDDPCPTELLRKVGREDAIQTIILSDKTESIESINTWSDLAARLQGWTGTGTLSYKHDGWNVQASYYNKQLVSINTRGRSSNAMRVEHLKAIIPNTIPVMGKVKIVMECTIPNSNFGYIRNKYNVRDQRASVSTILAHPEDVDLLQCHAFDIHGYNTQNKFKTLQDWGFNVPGHIPVFDYTDIHDGVYDLDADYGDYDSPTDGIVFDGGFKYAIRLLQWEETVYQSYVIGYDESFNRYVISPRLLIKPISRGGAMQRSINITNWERIIKMKLVPGSPVAFDIVSSSIANINELATRLLQQEYEGRYDEYKEAIDEAEMYRKQTFEAATKPVYEHY